MGASTNSLNFPQMFDVARNRVTVIEGTRSIANRSRLLILTEPTELYNEPDFGVGLKRYLWQYNTPNMKPIIRDRIAAQLDLHEPMCDAADTEYADGLLVTAPETVVPHPNKLDMTIGIHTKLGAVASVDFSDLQAIIDTTDELLNK